jgi:fumarate hydratase class II
MLSSGPDLELNEIFIPENEPGSSMPGKVRILLNVKP